jgi:hypothetical protein
MLFAIPGNHEDHQNIGGLDVGQWTAWMLDLNYFQRLMLYGDSVAGE